METSEPHITHETFGKDVSFQPDLGTQEVTNCEGGCSTSISVTGSENSTTRDLPQILDTDVEMGISAKALTGENADGGNNGSESDDEMVLVGESWIEERSTLVCVPFPGVPVTAEVKRRYVPNGCAICLSHFVGGDRVTWSATPSDPHVFHEQCMLRYLLTVGSKAARRRQRNQEGDDPDSVKDATDFAMLCPCCRQSFVSESAIVSPP